MSTNSDVLQSFLEVGVPRNDFKTLLQIVSAEVRERIEQHDEQVETFSELVGDAPELLNTLGELSDALGDDPQFFATIAAQVAELNTDVTATVTAMGIAENDTSMGTFSESVLPDDVDLKAVLEAFAVAWRTAKESIEAAASTIETNLATEIADRIAAITAEEQRVDALIASGMWLFTDQASFPDAAANHGRVVHSHADGAIFYAHGGMWHQVAKEVDLQTTISSVASEASTRETADTALSGRLDVLEADPTTQTLLDAEATAREGADTALSDRLDVLEADPITATDAASADATVLSTANTYTDTSITNLVNGADLALDTLKEIGDALQQGDDDVTTALTNQITTEATTRGNADTALSDRLDVLEADPTTATAVAAVQADVDQNETDADAADAALGVRIDNVEAEIDTARTNIYTALGQTEGATTMGTFTGSTLGDGQTIKQLLQTLETATEGETTARTAIAEFVSNLTRLKNDLRGTYINVGNNIELRPAAGGRVEIVGDLYLDNNTAIDGNGTTLTSFANINAYDGRLNTLEADPTTATAVAAVQADVDQNEADSDAADTALSDRLDVLEADPTTATAVAAVQSDVDQNEADADAALALRTLLDGSNIPGPYANDGAAATDGVAVGAIYKHDNGQIHYRVS